VCIEKLLFQLNPINSHCETLIFKYASLDCHNIDVVLRIIALLVWSFILDTVQ
jgi:hypothetical protein